MDQQEVKELNLAENDITKGFYRIERTGDVTRPISYNENKSDTDTFYISFIFMKDGVFISDPHFINHDDKMYFPKKLEAISRNEKSFFVRSVYFGFYSINGDTIKTAYAHKPYSWNDGWDLEEAWLLRKGNSSLSLIAQKKIKKDRAKDIVRIDKGDQLPVEFIPLDHIPEVNNSWLHRKMIKNGKFQE